MNINQNKKKHPVLFILLFKSIKISLKMPTFWYVDKNCVCMLALIVASIERIETSSKTFEFSNSASSTTSAYKGTQSRTPL